MTRPTGPTGPLAPPRPVHLLVPAGYDDPHRASGGNTYDREIACGLGESGGRVIVHPVSDAWPVAGPSVAADVGFEQIGRAHV